MHVYNHPFPSFPDNLLLLTYPRNRWLRHTQGHSLSIISYRLNTCNIIIKCRPSPPWNCIDEWRNNWLCLGCLSTLWHPRYCLIQHKASSTQRKNTTAMQFISHGIGMSSTPRRCHGGLPTSIENIHIDTTPVNGSMSDTVHTPINESDSRMTRPPSF
jgi:hypothetical protein